MPTNDSQTQLQPASWMRDSLPLIGGRPLRQISMPGAHCAGMGNFSGASQFSQPCNTQTQNLRVSQQLLQGVRYFDLQPAWGGCLLPGGISSGSPRFYLAHFSHNVSQGLQGATGEKLLDVLLGIEEFFSHPQHAQELLILKFSHYINFLKNQGFTRLKKRRLKALLLQILGPRLICLEAPGDLHTLSLSELLARGNILCLFDDFCGLYDAKAGIFAAGQQANWQMPLQQYSSKPVALTMGKNGVLHALFTLANSEVLLYCCSYDRGITWSKNCVLSHFSQHAASLVQAPDGVLYSAYLAADSRQIMLTCSHDDGQNWSAALPTGLSSQRAPALALGVDASLQLLFCLADSDVLHFSCSKDRGKSWQSAQALEYASETAPSLCQCPDGSLFALFSTQQQLFCCSSKNRGATWSEAVSLQQSSMGTAALCNTANGELHTAFLAADTQILMHGISNDGGKQWWYQTLPAPACAQAPALCGSADGSLYTVWAQSSGELYCNRSQLGLQWLKPVPVQQKTAHPASLAIGANGTLYCVFVQADNAQLGFCSSTDQGHSWSDALDLQQESEGAPSLALTPDGILYLLFQPAQQGQLCLCNSKDGGRSWSQAVPIGASSHANASLAADGKGGLYAVFVCAETGELCLYATTDGGKHWQQGARIDVISKYAPSLALTHEGLLYVCCCRSRDGKLMCFSSDDAGQSWQQAEVPELFSEQAPVLAAGPDASLACLSLAHQQWYLSHMPDHLSQAEILPISFHNVVQASQATLTTDRHGQHYLLFSQHGELFSCASVWGQVWHAQQAAADYPIQELPSHSHDASFVAHDQQRKLAAFCETASRSNPSSFALSWYGQCVNGVAPCIASIADQLNTNLALHMRDWVASGTIKAGQAPHLLLVDYYHQQRYDILAVAHALNQTMPSLE